MSVRMSILAMLAQKPSYGYLLRTEFDRRTGAIWPLNIGQVYQSLDALERDGLATRSEQTDADGHVFYEVTAAGRTEVETWLHTANPVSTPARSDLAIKIAMASTLPGVDLDDSLRAQRDAALGNLQRLTREMAETGGADDPVEAHPGARLSRQLIADSILFEAETELRWLDHVEQRIRQARAAGVELEVPLDTDPPRRGRPPRVSSATRGTATATDATGADATRTDRKDTP